MDGPGSERILVLGATGLIGQAVSRELGDKHRWYGTYYSKPTSGFLRCDLRNGRDLRDIFESVQPTHVINATGLAGGVDYCEKHPERAREFYIGTAGRIGKLCRATRARLLYVSSECVFDGKKETYDEKDEPTPLNIYGHCKAEAERRIAKSLTDYAIVRTMSVFGWQPETTTANAVMKMYFSIQRREKVFVSVDRWGTPTYSGDLAKAIVEILFSPKTGLFQVVGPTYINRYEWLRRTCERMGWDASLVIPEKEILTGIARRPLKVRLDSTKFSLAFKTRLHAIDEALALLQKDIMAAAQTLGVYR